MPIATLTIAADDPVMEDLGEREVVLVPLAVYNALLDKLEDLQDVADIVEAMKEPRRPFAEYLADKNLEALFR